MPCCYLHQSVIAHLVACSLRSFPPRRHGQSRPGEGTCDARRQPILAGGPFTANTSPALHDGVQLRESTDGRADCLATTPRSPTDGVSTAGRTRTEHTIWHPWYVRLVGPPAHLVLTLFSRHPRGHCMVPNRHRVLLTRPQSQVRAVWDDA